MNCTSFPAVRFILPFHCRARAEMTPSESLPVPPTSDEAPEGPLGEPPEPYSLDFANVVPTRYPGGTVKIADSRTFKVAKEIAVAEVSVEPNAMRELHVRGQGLSASAYPRDRANDYCLARSGTLPKTSGRTSCEFPGTVIRDGQHARHSHHAMRAGRGAHA